MQQYGVSLGTMAVRGERNALIVDRDLLSRIAPNPLLPYMLAHIEEGAAGTPAPPARTPPRTA